MIILTKIYLRHKVPHSCRYHLSICFLIISQTILSWLKRAVFIDGSNEIFQNHIQRMNPLSYYPLALWLEATQYTIKVQDGLHISTLQSTVCKSNLTQGGRSGRIAIPPEGLKVAAAISFYASCWFTVFFFSPPQPSKIHITKRKLFRFTQPSHLSKK